MSPEPVAPVRGAATPPSPPVGMLQGCLASLALIVFGLVIGLVFGEIAVRFVVPIEPVYLEWDPLTGVRHRAGMKGNWYRETTRPVHVELNSLGFRNAPLTREKPAGTVRVLMLGDSYLEGMQVPQPQVVSELLRDRLQQAMPGRRVEVLNGGVSGWGTAEQSLYLQHKAWPYSPDLVVSFLNLSNDLRDNWYKTGSPVRPSFELRNDSLVLHPPRLSRWKIILRDDILAHLEIPKLVRQYFIHRFTWAQLWAAKQGLILRNVAGASNRADEDEMLTICQKIYGRMETECAAHAVPLLVFEFPYGVQLIRDYPDSSYTSAKVWNDAPGAAKPYYRLGDEMASYLRRSGIPLVRADSAFAAAISHGDTVYIDFAGHWTAKGHAIAADLMSRDIIARRLLGATPAH